ncbi:hypothetical protein LLS1_14070 [Leifsonia sp. LS1]|nr:hypothetical protein LLS1_14070 [Leifsonia sp. LS1]
MGVVEGDLVEGEEPFGGAFHVVLAHATVGAEDVPDAVVDAAWSLTRFPNAQRCHLQNVRQ